MIAIDPTTRSCTSKIRYETQVIAESEATRIWLRNKVSLRSYACQHCGGVHLATTTTPEPRGAGVPTPAELRAMRAARREKERRIERRRRR